MLFCFVSFFLLFALCFFIFYNHYFHFLLLLLLFHVIFWLYQKIFKLNIFSPIILWKTKIKKERKNQNFKWLYLKHGSSHVCMQQKVPSPTTAAYLRATWRTFQPKFKEKPFEKTSCIFWKKVSLIFQEMELSSPERNLHCRKKLAKPNKQRFLNIP